MKKVFYYYSNHSKNIPKAFLIIIFLFILILTPLLLSLFIVGGILKLTGSLVSKLLPGSRKKIPTKEVDGTTIIDITPSDNKGFLR